MKAQGLRTLKKSCGLLCGGLISSLVIFALAGLFVSLPPVNPLVFGSVFFGVFASLGGWIFLNRRYGVYQAAWAKSPKLRTLENLIDTIKLRSKLPKSRLEPVLSAVKVLFLEVGPNPYGSEQTVFIPPTLWEDIGHVINLGLLSRPWSGAKWGFNWDEVARQHPMPADFHPDQDREIVESSNPPRRAA